MKTKVFNGKTYYVWGSLTSEFGYRLMDVDDKKVETICFTSEHIVLTQDIMDRQELWFEGICIVYGNKGF